MALTADEIKIAQDTIDKWFWQPVDGKFFRYKYAVKNLVRYYECAPVAADTLRIIIEYLRTEEVPVGGKISLLNKQVGGFDGWKAQDAWYQTAASDQWEGTKSDKIRIFQTLIGHEIDADGDGPYTVENGCRYKVTHTFYWNTEELPELPASSSGVNYTMQGVTRDRETGLYSCVIECRERQQQDVALYDSVKTQFETRQIEQHLGVKADDVEGTGEAASAENGVITERRLTKNEDCTTDIENVVTTEESVSEAVVEYRKTLRGTVTTILDRNQPEPLDESGMEVGETRRSEKTPGRRFNNTTVKSAKEAAGIIARSCTKTQFEHEHQTVENVESEPSASSASSASGGRIHTRTIRKTEENTFDVTDTVRTEESVSEAVVEYRRTPRSVYKTVVDRNQSETLNDSGMKVGEIRRSEKTPGRRYNNTVTNRIQTIAGKIATMCLKAGGGVMHQHMTVEMVESDSSYSIDSSASSAAPNYQHQRQIRQTDDGVQVENTVTQWNPESESESWSDEYYHYHHLEYVNQVEPLKPTGTHDNVSVNFHHNGHGTFDGSWTFRDGNTGGSGQTLQWSLGPAPVKGKVYFRKADGTLWEQSATGCVYRCGGKMGHVATEIQNKQQNGLIYDGSTYEACNFESLGWRTYVSGSYEKAYGQIYAVIGWGKPAKVQVQTGGSGNV